jgi:hypothetical protein
MAKINFDKEIYEGWTVRDFINELEPQLNLIQSGRSFIEPIKTKEELKKWCKENQPCYKKYVSDVVNYFAQKYNLK